MYAIGVVLFAVSGFSQLAAAADPCAGVVQSLTKQKKAEYATLIAKSPDKKVKPTSIEIDTALRSGTWTVIYASTPIADPGYFSSTVPPGHQCSRTFGVVCLMTEMGLF